MGKSKQLYNLRLGILIKSQRIQFLLQSILDKADCSVETQVFSEIALDEINRISRMSEKIGRIFKHY